MSKIAKDYDVVKKTPGAEQGSNFFENPGIKPSTSSIPMTPGEKAKNDPACESMSKAQPFGKGGSGYTNG